MSDEEHTESLTFKVTPAMAKRLDAQCSPDGQPKRSRSEILRWCLQVGLTGLEAPNKYQCLRCDKVYESKTNEPFCPVCTEELTKLNDAAKDENSKQLEAMRSQSRVLYNKPQKRKR